MTQEYIVTEEGLAELDKYFIEHKDSLFKIAWKNFKDNHIRPYNPQAGKKNYFGGKCTCNKFVNCHDCRDAFSSQQSVEYSPYEADVDSL